MDGQSKPPGSVTLLLVVMVLLVAAAGLVGAFVPMLPCPACDTEVKKLLLEASAMSSFRTCAPPPLPLCKRCSDTYRITVLRPWLIR